MQNLGHIGGSMSIADVLSVIMQNFDVKKDEIIFSKGHASPALYSALYLNKIITKKEIDGFRKVNGTLEGHPSIHTKGIKVATGSLGQGLSVGLRNGNSEKNYLKKMEKYMLLLATGEMQEGNIWEALFAISKYNPENLIVIIDANNVQLDRICYRCDEYLSFKRKTSNI